MNTTQSTTLYDFNAALLATASPYIVGVRDAQEGRELMTDDRYTRDGDKAEYVQGYNDELAAKAAKPVDERQRIIRQPRMLTKAEMDAENEDYREDMADRAFWASGQW